MSNFLNVFRRHMADFTEYEGFKRLRELAEKPIDLTKEGALSPKRLGQMVVSDLGLKLLYGTERVNDKVMEALKENFRPEFLNRIDEIIIFNHLSKADIKEIVELELQKVALRLSNKKIGIKITQPAKDLLAEKGFDANFGARPLKRVIQKLVLDPLAQKIVSGEVKKNDKIIIDAADDQIIFRGPDDLVTKKEWQKVSSKS